MRKKLILITLFSFIIVIFTSCSLVGSQLNSSSLGGSNLWDRFNDNDQKISDKKMEQILDAIINRDKSTMEKLFSKKSIAEVKDLDGSISKLFDYFQGNFISYNDWNAVNADGGINDPGTGRSWKCLYSTFDVKTTKITYRFAIKEFIQDTANSDNVGICSLYIIKMEDDTDKQFAYRGDGKDTPGINFNVKNVLPKEDS